jgi:hypothetical protein
MKVCMCMAARQSKRLALVSVIALVLLGVLSCGQKERPKPPTVHPFTTIPMCKAQTIMITPAGSQTAPPTVSVELCTIVPGDPITWQCQAQGQGTCTGWTVMFDDSSVVDTLLFNGAVTFGDIGRTGKTQDSAVLANSSLLSSGPIIVKYTVQTQGNLPYDPHIMPMNPTPP